MGRGYLKDQYEKANDLLFSEISRGMELKHRKNMEIGKFAGFSKSNWYKRRSNPSGFRLGELRAIFDALGTSNDVILSVFGRK